ncbi:RHS repeat-associated core domain-containing protein [Paenibacillus chitinolyticus]|uniref:RHS repeat-associated core domain-containing protein n=1 Tax=Paenibacillus chitinolyticus TaxID=79263 RepID=UPI00366F7002
MKKNSRNSIIFTLVVILVTFFNVSYAFAEDVTKEMEGVLNGLTTPQLINESSKSDFEERRISKEAIDPETGSLTIDQTDISLPGRDGLDLTIGRKYNSSQAEYGSKKSNFGTLQLSDCYKEPVYNYYANWRVNRTTTGNAGPFASYSAAYNAAPSGSTGTVTSVQRSKIVQTPVKYKLYYPSWVIHTPMKSGPYTSYSSALYSIPFDSIYKIVTSRNVNELVYNYKTYRYEYVTRTYYDASWTKVTKGSSGPYSDYASASRAVPYYAFTFNITFQEYTTYENQKEIYYEYYVNWQKIITDEKNGVGPYTSEASARAAVPAGAISSNIVQTFKEYKTICTPRYVNFMYSSTDPYNYLHKRYDLGAGWSFKFPSVEVSPTSPEYLYFNDGNGGSYRVDFSLGNSNLVNYQGKDVSFQRISDNSENKYVFIDSQQRKSYFSSDGRILSIQDRFGNKISFSYTYRTVNGVSLPYLSKITDSIGRIISLSYSDNVSEIINNQSVPTDQITVTILDPSNDALNHKIKYTKIRDSVDGRVESRLWRVTEAFGSTAEQNIYMDYDSKLVQFNYGNNKADALSGDSKTGTIFLKTINKISYPNSVSYYQYESVARSLGTTGVFEGYRVKNRYDLDRRYNSAAKQWYEGSSRKNEKTYQYVNDFTGYPSYNNADSLPDSYSYGMEETTLATNLKNKIMFNGKHQKIQEISTANNGEKVATSYQKFDTNFPLKPTLKETSTYSKDSSDSNPVVTKLYNAYTYNEWGGLASSTNLLTHDQLNDANTKTYSTTSYEYEPVYHQQTKKTWYQNPTTKLAETYQYDTEAGKQGRLKAFTNANNELVTYDYSLAVDGNQFQVAKVTKSQNLENGKVSKEETYFDPSAMRAFPTSIKRYSTANGKNSIESVSKKYSLLYGLVTSETDDNDKLTTSYTFDSLGRMLSKKLPDYKGKDGAVYQTEQRWEYTQNSSDSQFDAVNQNMNTLRVRSYQAVTSNGISNNYDDSYTYYDGFGNVILQYNRSIGSVVKQYHYDDLSRPNYESDALGNVSSIIYDSWGSVLEGTDSLGNLYHIDRDIHSRKQTSFLIPQIHVTNYKQNPSQDSYKENVLEEWFDNNNRLIKRSAYPYFPDRSKGAVSESYTYDLQGNLVGYTDPKGNLTSHRFDKLNRLDQVTDALGQKTSYSYNVLGLLKNIIQSDGTTTWIRSKDYDELGHLTKNTDADNKSDSYTFTANGLLESKKNPKQTNFNYQYDELHRQTSVTDATYKYKRIFGSSPYGSEKEEEYVGSALLRSSSKTYNSSGLLQTSTFLNEGFSNSISYEYDALGRKKSVQDPFGSKATYTYQKTKLEKVYTNEISGPSQPDNGFAKYEYNGNGTVKSITYPKLTDGSYLKTTYTYDKINRLLSLVNTKGDQVLSRFDYTYDPNGNIQTVTDSNGRSTYSYDKLNRLIQVDRADGSSDRFTYDARGNRLSGQTNSLFVFENVTYSYDEWNQLTAAVKGTIETNYQYGPNNLRSKKTSQGETTRYSYDQSGKLLAESDLENKATASYVWGPDRLLVKNDKLMNKQYFYLYNGHGDVIQIVDTDGKIQNNYSYDEWGKVLSQTENVKNSFKFAGEIYDPETELYYLKARYYDPSIGRFINKDTYEGDINNPLSLNLYTYVWNNPLKFVDPTGHAAWDLRNYALEAIFDGLSDLLRRAMPVIPAMEAITGYNGFTKQQLSPAQRLESVGKAFTYTAGFVSSAAIPAYSSTASSRQFFTVQNSIDEMRLINGGKPWPTAPYKSHLGEGVYAWDNLETATNYLNVKQMRNPEADLKIVKFKVNEVDIRNFRSFNVDGLPEIQGNAWLERYSKLNGGNADHGYQYVQRGTNFGVENFFDKSIIKYLKFSK